jgi:hypothetical protein
MGVFYKYEGRQRRCTRIKFTNQVRVRILFDSPLPYGDCRETEVVAHLPKGPVNSKTRVGSEVAPRYACTHLTMNAIIQFLKPVPRL